MPKCEHGLTSKECYVCASPKHGAALAQQAKPQGCEHCNHPLYAATKCRVCGRVTEPKAEPVQEPVAWVLDGTSVVEFDRQTYHDGPEWTPLYAVPPQRKPLTDEEVFSIFRTSGSPVAFARAIERAHGIGEEK